MGSLATPGMLVHNSGRERKRTSPVTRSSYGPEQRHLLESTASRIYANAVAHGSLRADDPRLAVGQRAPRRPWTC